MTRTQEMIALLLFRLAMIALILFGFALVYAGFYYQQERNSQPIPVFVIEGVYDGK